MAVEQWGGRSSSDRPSRRCTPTACGSSSRSRTGQPGGLRRGHPPRPAALRGRGQPPSCSGLTQLNHLVASLHAQGVAVWPDTLYARRRPCRSTSRVTCPRPGRRWSFRSGSRRCVFPTCWLCVASRRHGETNGAPIDGHPFPCAAAAPSANGHPQAHPHARDGQACAPGSGLASGPGLLPPGPRLCRCRRRRDPARLLPHDGPVPGEPAPGDGRVPGPAGTGSGGQRSLANPVEPAEPFEPGPTRGGWGSPANPVEPADDRGSQANPSHPAIGEAPECAPADTTDVSRRSSTR